MPTFFDWIESRLISTHPSLIIKVRRFLDAGKLHNLVKALADEEGEDLSTAERKSLLGPEHSLGLGLGFRVPTTRPGSKGSSSSVGSGSIDLTGDSNFQVAAKGAMKRFLGPLSNKPMAYLSAFILYITTVGDIVDGVDTTHDFNFFTLIYERPNDVRLSQHCSVLTVLIL